MEKYHKYVFDQEKKEFLGKFEEMYQQEDIENYDSWYQDDMSSLSRRVSLCILDHYNFKKILDLGCGKGTFSHLLKKANNQVTAVDISPTAIEKAKARYRGVEFIVSEAEAYLKDTDDKFDLVVLDGVAAYLKNWREVIKEAAAKGEYLFATLYVPENSIAPLRSFKDLRGEIAKYFQLEVDFTDNILSRVFLLGKKR